MKRPFFIARQSARPSRVLGRSIANFMAHETADLNERAVRPEHFVLISHLLEGTMSETLKGVRRRWLQRLAVTD